MKNYFKKIIMNNNDDKTKWCHYDKINDTIDGNNVVIIWINLFANEVK